MLQTLTTISVEAVAKIREEMESVNDNDAELLYWLPEGVQLVVIEVCFRKHAYKA